MIHNSVCSYSLILISNTAFTVLMQPTFTMKKYKQCNQVIEKMNDVMKYDVWKSIQIHWKIYKLK